MAPKFLFIVDFDNTLIAQNTDHEIIKQQSIIGKCISAKNWFTNTVGWSESMSFTLEELHKYNFRKQDIDKIILEIPLIDGMSTFCEFLEKYKHQHDAVILSHANQYFIDILLRKYNLTNTFKNILTYACEWDIDEKLLVKAYDNPYTNCELCPIDFCKGVCVQTYLDVSNYEKNIQYDSVVYVGDGTADYCGGLALTENDYVLCRKDFSLHKRILQDCDGSKKLKAKYEVWENGYDVVNFIEKLINQSVNS